MKRAIYGGPFFLSSFRSGAHIVRLAAVAAVKIKSPKSAQIQCKPGGTALVIWRRDATETWDPLLYPSHGGAIRRLDF